MLPPGKVVTAIVVVAGVLVTVGFVCSVVNSGLRKQGSDAGPQGSDVPDVDRGGDRAGATSFRQEGWGWGSVLGETPLSMAFSHLKHLKHSGCQFFSMAVRDCSSISFPQAAHSTCHRGWGGGPRAAPAALGSEVLRAWTDPRKNAAVQCIRPETPPCPRGTYQGFWY